MTPERRAELRVQFEQLLPEDKEWFSIRWLARHLSVTPSHISNLIDSGELKVVLDLRGKTARRSSLTISRSSIIDFLVNRSVEP